MKYISVLAAGLLLAACGQAPATVAPTGAKAPAAAPVAPTTTANLGRRNFTLAETAKESALIVRYKSDRHGITGFNGQRLALANTVRYPIGDVHSRAELLQKLEADSDVDYVEPDYKLYAFSTPNDPDFNQQWDMSKVQLGPALDKTKGDASVIVASVDSGVDYNHPDLAGQVIKGHDFANGDDDPMDDNGHGTHTSGTMAALTNNGVGVAGMAGGCKILAVKVLDAQGSGDTSAIADGIDYAVKHGAKVINMSLGGPQENQTLHAAVQDAVKAGVVVVAAAGNDGQTTPNYPAAYPEVLSVGATDQNDARTSFSTYGSWVNIAAPGAKILSTFKGGTYKTEDGTSMASPHVAGAAALVRSLHPDWTVDQVKAALVSTGDPCTGFEENPNLRRLNVAKALSLATAPAATPAPAAPVATDPGSQPGDMPQMPGQPGGMPQMPQPQMPGGQPGMMPQYPGMPAGQPAAMPTAAPMPAPGVGHQPSRGPATRTRRWRFPWH